MGQKDRFADRDTLLAELHHRVRNNLQIIISALNLQLRELRSEEAIAALQESIDRITSFSLIQNLCYDASDAGRIDFGSHLAELRKQHLKAGERPLGLSLIIEGPKLILPLSQAIPCSMAISELIFASCKYEHQSQASDRYDSVIHLDFTEAKDSFQISIRGTPIHRVINLDDSNCLELRLCKALIGQLSGQIRFQPDCNNHSLSRVLIDGPLVR
jgi:two-component sensor histidine kinase